MNEKFELLKGEMTPVPGFSQYLCHTPTGRVYSKVSCKWLFDSEFCKGTGDNGQYLMTRLIPDNGGKPVPMYKYEIVLSSAMGVTKDYWLSQGLQIDHIDKNPRNNKLENLRLVTDQQNKQNSRDRHWNKVRLSLDISKHLREEFKNRTCAKIEWYRQKGIELGVSARSVQNIILSNTYREATE
jgi:hypothetical protein